MQDDFKIAIALTKDLKLPENHFGESEKFLIYKYSYGSLRFVKSIPNHHRNDDEGQHGKPEKGRNIAGLLQKEDVNCVVSRYFGKNIRIISEFFLPVIVPVNDVKKVISLLDIKAEKIVLEAKTHVVNPKSKALKL
jgi:predicted Fe-Mo cluster-binding NifX family protein